MTTLDLQGAASLMKIHPVTLGRMINDGKIPAARIGRAYVLMERDVLGYIERQITAQTARKAGGGVAPGAAAGSMAGTHALR